MVEALLVSAQKQTLPFPFAPYHSKYIQFSMLFLATRLHLLSPETPQLDRSEVLNLSYRSRSSYRGCPSC